MRYLAVDLGQKRTGIAVGDSVTGIVTPVEVLSIPVGEELLNAVAGVCVEHLGEKGSGGEVVIGLPLNMDGTEGPAARAARQFGASLGERAGRVVHFMDERLSSAQAEWEMARTGLTRGQKKERRDALAAAAVLRDFLEVRRQPGPGGVDAGGKD